MSDNEEIIVNCVNERVSEWETGMAPQFGLWDEWNSSYGMKFTDKDPRPAGISKNVSAEIPRATNTLASTITRMQTAADPPFDLRAIPGSQIEEEQIFYMEGAIQEILNHTQYKRYLSKGNRSMCLFGTQVWEKPLIPFQQGFGVNVQEGTALRPISLLQAAFNPQVYDMEYSDHLTPVVRINKHILRDMAYSNDGIWDIAKVEEAIDAKAKSGGETLADSNITKRRQQAGINETQNTQHILYLYNGRVSKEVIETPEFGEMWQKYGNGRNPRLTDITIGILDKKFLVRFHPTPYGTWKHMFNVGHYMEWELEPIGKGVGSMGFNINKDINKIMRNVSDVGKFNLFSMMLAGRGSGLKSNYMNVFPFSAIPVDDVDQIKPLQPNVDGMNHGINLVKLLIDDLRGVTNATDTLQAIITGATATESNLAQGSALRSVGLIAEINVDSVNRPYFRTLIQNLIDQNPYDNRYVPVQVDPKLTSDKDYKPEHSQRLIEILNAVTSIRNNTPLDFNPMPVLKYLCRSVGINPREVSAPRPQIDRMLDVLKRLNANGQGKEALAVEGEAAGAGAADGNVRSFPGPVPTSPVGAR